MPENTRSVNTNFAAFLVPLLFCTNVCCPLVGQAQSGVTPLYKVLTLPSQRQAMAEIAQDQGLNGVWQKLLKLKTVHSVLTTQAHPDDEQADLLTYLSRGLGTRVGLLSLNRGESGSNILGPESFDQLGMLRTEEFLLAASYYGLDDLYFTNLVDYGYSKRVEEAYDKWGKAHVLEEMVRVIRINRPLVIISRFHGSKRDGHGNHQAAGEMSPDAFRMAADPKAFPEQISKEGLRPWKALRFYRGGIDSGEHWNVAVNTGVECPWLGDSYKNLSLLGYSFHRSQFNGQQNHVNGDYLEYFEQLDSPGAGNEKQAGFFDGIDGSLAGVLKLTGEKGLKNIQDRLTRTQQLIQQAIAAFGPNTNTSMLRFLTDALKEVRMLIASTEQQPETRFILKVKEQQLMDAINAVAGVKLEAVAIPAAAKEPDNGYEQPVTMGFAVPGQHFKVGISFLSSNATVVNAINIKLESPVPSFSPLITLQKQSLHRNEPLQGNMILNFPAAVLFTRPYYHRSSIEKNRYDVDNATDINLPGTEAALQCVATYLINGVAVNLSKPVLVRQANLPYGFDKHKIRIAPALAVNLSPRMGIIMKGESEQAIDLQIELANNSENPCTGQLGLNLPPGWNAVPASIDFHFTKAGERTNFAFRVHAKTIEQKNYEIKAVATVNGMNYSEGYDLSEHRDLDPTLFYHEAVSVIKGIEVKTVAGLQVGYVMGAGDELPGAIQRLGATVQLLTTADLASAALEKFDAILVGSRAYAVRQDLNTYNARLLAYAKNGGSLVILFQTPEFVPVKMAAFPALLPDNSEEISEENSPVEILNPNHQFFNFPNKITLAEFDGWVEQRGSKFFSAWDTAYKPLLATHDKGQALQKGGWLTARYGKGNYTYFAYALYRQLPNSVTGAYKLLANLLAYGKSKKED